ncbi:MAG TPA: DUF6356 family protein [Kiloniellales bacterium]
MRTAPSLESLFAEHPASVGETYGQHLAMATSFGARMILGGLACLVHGILPFLFVRTGSETITDLHRRMVTQRSRRMAESRESAAAALTRQGIG